jgi:hypothetical protein
MRKLAVSPYPNHRAKTAINLISLVVISVYILGLVVEIMIGSADVKLINATRPMEVFMDKKELIMEDYF